MSGFLEDIRQLSEHGDTAAAFELIDLWLDEHPADHEARLLKADLCLAHQQDYHYVGQLLLESAHLSGAALESLRRRSADLAWSLIAAGRDHLRSRYPVDALADFDHAVALQPTDPIVALAAGLALARIAPMPETFAPTSLFDDARRRLSPARLTSEVEKHLRRVIDALEPDQRPYEVAALALVRLGLTQDRLTPGALALLARVVDPSPATSDLLAELRRRVIALTLDTLANLLRIGLPDKAAPLFAVCERAQLVSSALLIAQAECLPPDQALAAYQRALDFADQPPSADISLDAARTLLLAVQGVQVKCPFCGKSIPPTAPTCSFCETSLLQTPLLSDRYPDLPDALLARIGILDLLVRQGRAAEALDNWQAAVDLLPADHRAAPALHQLHARLIAAQSSLARSSAQALFAQLRAAGLTSDLVARIRQINQTQPDDWRVLSLAQRAALVRKLVAAEQLPLAEQTLAAAFADRPDCRTALNLRTLLASAFQCQSEAALAAVEALQAAGEHERAVERAGQALDLRADARLYQARGRARLALGGAADLAALDDFYAAEACAQNDADRAAARKAAALVLERRWHLDGARVLLDSLDPRDPDVRCAQARLDRRVRGEPFVLVERVAAAVMQDSLMRRPLPPAEPLYQGCFALTVREVGALDDNRETLLRKILSAHADFVQLLGALRDLLGDAVFVLRTISQPHRHIPERGRVTVALLARVSAADQATCQARALQLWADLYAMLPLAQENIYSYEPVVDPAELCALLTPFEIAHAAEIVHRHTAAVVSPFLPASLDLHALHWALLRQPAPALLSIHLQPTRLLPWEDAPLSAAEPAADAAPLLAAVASSAELIQQQLAAVQLYQQLRTERARLQSLQSAYLLRLTVAGSPTTSPLLPEMIAAALFAPLSAEGQGGYEIVRPTSQPEFDGIVRNLASLDLEAWLPDATRLPYLVAEREAAQIFRLPIPAADGVPGLRLLDGKPVVPPAGMPERGLRLGLSVAQMRGLPLPITQSEADRRRHLYVVGKTGMGKSTLLLNLILQDIEANRGVFLLDPHGDLCDDVLARIPAHRADDVILLDPSDAERPIGLNILDAETEADQQRVINEFIGLLIRLYDPHNQAIVGPIFQQSVRNAMLAAMSLPDGTLIDVYRLLSDPLYVKRILPHVKDPLVRHYWDDLSAKINSASDHWKAELLPYLLSKFSRFVEDSTLRRMIGQPRTSIPYRRLMDEGKILLVNLAKGRIGQENAQFIGSLVLSSVLQAAFQRGETPAARRREFYIYIDEVQNYSTPLLATMLSEGRKFGVILTLANQFLHQLDGGIREAVFGNVGSLVAFRVGTQDAPVLASEFYPLFSPADLLNLPQFTTVTKLLIDGVAARPFTMRTLPALAPADADLAAMLREQSRQRYGTAAAQVQAEIQKKF